ncbi:MAG: right-handed parallel beta-helix repeat-containing protein, partial [Planctomycetota bacterium]
ILSGDLNNDDLPDFVNYAENSYHVTTGSGTDNTAVLDGFTITAGNSTWIAVSPDGAGMSIISGSPTIASCVFTANYSVDDGAGLYAESSSPIVTNCTFDGNWTAESGGGMASNIDSNPVLTGCVFSDNTADLDGGGLSNHAGGDPILSDCIFTGNVSPLGGGMSSESSGDYSLTSCAFTANSASEGGAIHNAISSPTLTGCTFAGNTSSSGGGAVWNDAASPTLVGCIFQGNTSTGSAGGAILNTNAAHPMLTNCVMVGNSAYTDGGAILNNPGSNPILINCTVAWNSADMDGGGILSWNCNPTLTNCILWGNTDAGGSGESAQIFLETSTVTIDYCDVAGWTGSLGGTGNFGSDPLFTRDPDDGGDGWGVGNNDDYGDLRLSSGSPCIDAADNIAVPADALDLDADLDVTEHIPFDLAGRLRFDNDLAMPDTGQADPAYPDLPIVDMGAHERTNPIYVDAGASGANDGTSWTDAYVYLQDALTQAGDDGAVAEIWVAAGTYRPDRNTANPTGTGDRSATFQLLDDVSIYGGFAGTETSLDQRDVDANETVLSGDLAANDGPDFANNDENSYHVVTGSGTNSAAVLDGFTITAGNADGANPDDSGGGMYNDAACPTVTNCAFDGNACIVDGGGMFNDSASCPALTDCTFTGNYADERGGAIANHSESSPTLVNCVFNANTAGWGGGGMRSEGNSDPRLIGCTFTMNSAEGGGALEGWESSPTLVSCVFNGNSATTGGGSGGAMQTSYGSPMLTNCIFTGNQAGADGGALANADCDAVSITSCIFVGNQADDDGGAISNWGCAPILTNCTIVGNTAHYDGGGIEAAAAAFPNVANCVLWGNSDEGGTDESAQLHHDGTSSYTVSYSLIEGLSEYAGSGNIDGDPLFMREPDDGGDGWGIGGNDDYGDLRLSFGSPCIDAANNDAVPADIADLDGDGDTDEPTPFDLAEKARFVDDPDTIDTGNGTAPIVDMGAYEYFTDCNGNGIPDDCDVDCGNPGEECDVPGCGESPDCNGNGLPDECEVPADTTLSAWTGAGDGTNWSDPLNWCPEEVPANDAGATYVAIIGLTGAVVELDTSPTLDGLTIADSSITLQVSSGTQSLTMAPGRTLVNNGTIRALAAGATLQLGGNINQAATGTIAAPGAGGHIAVQPGAAIVGGRLSVTDGAITLNASTATNVTLVQNGAGTIDVKNNGTLVDPTVETLRIPDGNIGFIEGVVANKGLISIDSTASLTGLRPTFPLDAVFTPPVSEAGVLQLSENPAESFSRAVVGDGFTYLYNNADHTIQGTGRIDAASLVNEGSVIAQDVGNRALNLLTFDVDNRGLILGEDGAELYAIGDMTVSSAGGELRVDGDALATLLGTLTVGADGVVAAVDAPSAPLSASLYADGLVLLGDGIEAGGAVTLTESMTMDVSNGIVIDGVTLCPPGRGCTPPILNALASSAVTTDTIDVLTFGRVELSGDAILDVAGPITIDAGGVFYGTGSSAASVTAGSVSLSNSDSDGAALTLGGSLRFTVDGDMDLYFSDCKSRGCTPPILEVAGAVWLEIGGALSIVNAGNIQVQSSEPVFLAGDFDNRSTDPSVFDWNSGRLTLDGSSQTFETAGADVGAQEAGFIDNFAMGEVEVAAGTTVLFVDAFNNDEVGQDPCTEALYVQTLVLRSGSTIQVDDCKVYYTDLLDEGANIVTTGCGALLPVAWGDLNCDDLGDQDDIEPFALALTDPVAYAATYPGCPILNGDMNGDGAVDGVDIQAFVTGLLSP